MAKKKHEVLVACRPQREKFEALKEARRKKGGLVVNVFTNKGREANKKAAAAKKAWKQCLDNHDGATPRFYVHGFARAMKDIGIQGGPNPESIPHKIIQTRKSDMKVAKAMKAKNLPDARVRAEKAAKAKKIKNAAIFGTRASASKEALRVAGNVTKGVDATAGALTTVSGILLAFPEPVLSKAAGAIIGVVAASASAASHLTMTALTSTAAKSEQKYQDEVLRQKAARGKKAGDAEVARMNAELAETERLTLQAERALMAKRKQEEARIEWYENPTTWIAVGFGLAAFVGVGMFARRQR